MYVYMAPAETWLVKVKKTILSSSQGLVGGGAPKKASNKPAVIKKSNVGVLAFEISGLMSKLLHLWQSLSDKNVIRLRNESLSLEGVRKIVSNDENFLLGLACAEMVENLRLVAKSVSRISNKCEDSHLRSFSRLLDEFSNTGRDPHHWVLSSKEMEVKIVKKMDHYVSVTGRLHREMDELLVLENGLRKSLLLLHSSAGSDDVVKEELNNNNNCNKKKKEKKLIHHHEVQQQQQKLLWQRQEVKYLKERSLWCRSFDTATSLLARSIFTILARIKLVFGIGSSPTSLPRSLSASATVYPSENPNNNTTNNNSSSSFVSGPLIMTIKNQNQAAEKFFEKNSEILKPPSTTLGAAALSLHYANLIIVIEKMIRSPQLVGVDARDDLYSMLPNSIRSSLRGRLKGVGFSASDPILAGEWRDALQKILGWLSPLAHNMIKWQSERSFEQQSWNINVNNTKTNGVALLLQTLYFANREKTEAAITELLVGLNYIWRFEREMNAKALLECGFLNICKNNQIN